MKPAYLLPVIALLVTAPVAAAAAGQKPLSPDPPERSPVQNEPARLPRFGIGLGMMIGAPVGDFGDNVEIAGGLSGYFAVGLGRSPISVAGEATYMFYGSESRDVPLSGMPDLTVGVSTSNDIFLLHGRVRAQKREGRVRPYVDGLVGFIDLVTTTSIEGNVSCSGSTCSNDGDLVTNLRDLAFSAGGGAGVMFALGASPQPPMLDLSVRYLYGGTADYLTEGAIRWGAGPAILQPRRSRTDIVLVNIGLAAGR